ncbi:MAG TPA: hypothetical protein EYH45_03850 [Candidatus Caldiarchaeum subterraneum]|uniref:MobA-like NTP transferase domain-containing protein n=1 Tax=Caldiarchaeum subterraneum TaxID=311458 RepID=A0A832ZVJ0_CALS0|nr:hypothetical protein [Candidatus Caldarchaeum subterraneum]
MVFSAVVLANVKPLMGRPKGLVEVNGRPMIEYVLDAIPPDVSDIMIAVNEVDESAYEEIYDRYLARPLTMTEKEKEFAKQLHKYLKDAQGSSLLVLPCDTPLITQAITMFLLDVSKKFAAAIPRTFSGRNEFVPAAYQVKPFIEAINMNPNLNMDELVRKIRNILYINMQSFKAFDPKLHFIHHINNKDDVRRVSEILKKISKEEE